MEGRRAHRLALPGVCPSRKHSSATRSRGSRGGLVEELQAAHDAGDHVLLRDAEPKLADPGDQAGRLWETTQVGSVEHLNELGLCAVGRQPGQCLRQLYELV